MKNLKLTLIALLFTFNLSPNLNMAKAEEIAEEVIDQTITEEEIEELAEVLEVLFENDESYFDDEGNLLGFDVNKISNLLDDNMYKEEIIKQLNLMDLDYIPEQNNSIYIDKEIGNRILLKDLKNSPSIGSGSEIGINAANCAFYGKKEKQSAIKYQNDCIVRELKKNYGPVTIASTIANAIAQKQYTKAAKSLLKIIVKGNIAGVIVTLAAINVICAHAKDKKFPGKTNCVGY